jgi:hypothetical protein
MLLCIAHHMTRPAKSLILIGAVLAAAAVPRTVHTESANRVLTATIPAAQFTHLDLRALDGTVDLKADPNPSATNVTVSVALDPPRRKNFKKILAADPANIEIDWTGDRNVLRLGLKNAEEGNVEATWTITVPARFSARIDVHNGAAVVNGLAGGVDASVSAGLAGERGTIDVNVPRGRLNLTMGVGNIRAVRASSEFSNATVRATVGDAELYLLGHEIVAPHEPGPGHHVSLDGKGPESLSLKVSVGDVSLKIG